jgi:predicted dehydrogenase
VLVATPDHWHSQITVDACLGGKGVYLETPISNGIDPAIRMLEAVRRTKRVVQVGILQRSWRHFGECAGMIRGGLLGG